MTRILPLAIAVVVMVSSAVVQGIWAERWGEFPELKEFAARFDNVPLEVGDWTGEVFAETDPEILKAAGAERIMSISYRNARTEEVVHVNLVCARLQDIFYHTPERCYKAHGFEQVTDTQEKTVDCGGVPAEFRTANFKRTTDRSKDNLRIFWSWSAHGVWQAPSSPKWTFSGQRALFKVYVENSAEGQGGTIDRGAFDQVHSRVHARVNESSVPAECRDSDHRGKIIGAGTILLLWSQWIGANRFPLRPAGRFGPVSHGHDVALRRSPPRFDVLPEHITVAVSHVAIGDAQRVWPSDRHHFIAQWIFATVVRNIGQASTSLGL